MTEYGPTHLLVRSDDVRTLCGEKSGETYPHMLARFVAAHRAGHERVGAEPPRFCTACVTTGVEQGTDFGELRDQ